jgi:hypothetical protein
MIILPYYIVKQSDSPLSYVAWIFLMNGGKQLWKTDETGKLTNKFVIDNYLTPNGIMGKCHCVKGDVMYFQVDTVVTKIANFYKLTDFLKEGRAAPDDIDIWRPFVWLPNDASWGSSAQAADGFLEKFWSTCCPA